MDVDEIRSKTKASTTMFTSSSFSRSSYPSPDYRMNSPRHNLQKAKEHRVEEFRRTNASSQSDNLKHSTSWHPGGASSSSPVGERTPLLRFPGNGSGTTSVNRELKEVSELSTSSSSFFSQGSTPPEMVQWLIPALICAFAYALYNIFIKKGSASIHPVLGGVILQFVAAIMGSILCGILTFGPAKEEMFYDSTGAIYAILAGASVGMAEIISFAVSGMGVPVVQSIPIIIGGSVMFGTLMGRIFLAEILSPRGWIGVVMIASGISLVAMES